jgi:hypothetical protein
MINFIGQDFFTYAAFNSSIHLIYEVVKTYKETPKDRIKPSMAVVAA